MLPRKQINKLQRKIIKSFQKYYSFQTSSSNSNHLLIKTIRKTTNYNLILKIIISKIHINQRSVIFMQHYYLINNI